MKQDVVIPEDQSIEAAESRSAGEAASCSMRSDGRRAGRARKPPISHITRMLSQSVPRENIQLLYDNLRLIRTAEREVREFFVGLRNSPLVRDASGGEIPRVVAIARAYLDHVQNRFTEENCAAFLDGFQD